MRMSAGAAPAGAATSTCRCPKRPATTASWRRWRRGCGGSGPFAPDALVIALGLDAFEGDPFGGLAVSTAGFGRIGAALAGIGLPTVIVQEGGYLCTELGQNLTSFLTGFENRQTGRPV